MERAKRRQQEEVKSRIVAVVRDGRIFDERPTTSWCKVVLRGIGDWSPILTYTMAVKRALAASSDEPGATFEVWRD